ncbi:hypothetical protein WA1_49450 [Scytonema hofmannii PCC 7110]|uniref:Uncharacterized protein n=1 Tax=Scytonema hofmannii PCC 7110 TaxID=128403 RepID=A0A139WQR5_9CYAN|nr:hypothetical protein [Scytonema hofmannii]KYC34766.1 hypothetical protein WA1_49450 [Scytonema hofmannii PCC 7110]
MYDQQVYQVQVVENPCEDNPYEDYETIDDTDYPLAHGSFLPHLSGLLPVELIFRLGQGEQAALNEVYQHYGVNVYTKTVLIWNRLAKANYWEKCDRKAVQKKSDW